MNNLPIHVGIIMDGNGRWATERGLKRSMGHKEGGKNLKKLCKHIAKLKIPYLSVFAFSTENFKREKEEVNTLMGLFIEYFQKEFSFLMEDNVRVLFSGRREPLPKNVLQAMDEIVERTKKNTGPVFHICLNYGGQTEVVDMTKKISKLVKENKLEIESITTDTISKYLYQDLPPLDFVIRTSGEQRISNFMLYQAAYAEFYFPNVYFPDFNIEEFDLAMSIYQSRNRRFGGIKK